MAESIKLNHYLPAPSEVPSESVLAVRQRLATYLQEWWPELDTRPNSVFGDLYLTPMAVLTASLEMAYRRRDSDLNLDNIARGVIFDPEFVDGFLTNFGSLSRAQVASSGVIRIELSEDRTYVFNADQVFDFNGQSFRVRPEEGNPVILRGTQDQGAGRRLLRETDSMWSVLLPVQGPAGVSVSGGAVAGTTWSEASLVGVTAVGDFDSGSLGDDLATRALRARYLFAAATLTSRAGAESFVRSMFPALSSVSAVVTGDPEMIREGGNVLAVSEGALDLYVRSRPVYASNQVRIRLAYDRDLDSWVGRLITPVPPAFFSSSVGVFRADRGPTERSRVIVHARSAHPSADGLGVAYSRFEELGLQVLDEEPERFQEAAVSTVTQLGGPTADLLVAGEYGSSVFAGSTDRNVSLRYDGVETISDTIYARFVVRDLNSDEAGKIYFVAEAGDNPTYGLLVPGLGDAEVFFNGLQLQLMPESGSFDPAAFSGGVWEFNFQARSAEFLVDYRYDPALLSVDQTVTGDANRPVGVSVMTKSFVICQITKFVVNYRSRVGGTVNFDQARQQIFDYVNTRAYPDGFEISSVGAIMLQNGASGMPSLQTEGRIYPTLAHRFVDQLGAVSEINHPQVTDLRPPTNSQGYGRRNLAYLLDLSVIEFNLNAD